MPIRRLLSLAAGLLIAAPVESAPPTAEQFAANAHYRNMILSPDGRHLAVTYGAGDNEVKLKVTSLDLATTLAVFEFGDDHHVSAEFWANNERLVVQAWENTGYLDGRVRSPQRFAADLDGGSRQKMLNPFGSTMRLVDRLRHDPDHVLVTSSFVGDKGEIKLKKVNIHTGRTLDFENLPSSTPGAEIVDIMVDSSDTVRIAVEHDQGKKAFDPGDDVRWVHYRNAAGDWRKFQLDSVRAVPSFGMIGFAPDDRSFYFLSNHDMAEGDTLGAFALDTETGDLSLAFRHPAVNVQDGVFGPLGEVLGVVFSPGLPERHYFDESNPWVQLRKDWSQAFPGQDVVVTSWSENGSKAVLLVYSDRNPGQFHLYRAGQLSWLADVRPDLDTASLGRTMPISLLARDGVRLHGYLTLPVAQPTQNLPMVVWVHGGPFGAYDIWGYDADVQLLAANGYAVLQVNFRGSGNYGQDFIESGFRQWGRKMQDDVTDATLWAIQEGYADARRVCIGGASYGGYAALQGVIREPGLYRCAIGIAGIYSLPMYRSMGDYRVNAGAADAHLDRFVGRDMQTLKAYSPAYNVDDIQADLLIIHGTEDARVPFKQATFLRRQLDRADKDYQWLQREEGHGFTRVINRLDQFQAMLAFLERNTKLPSP
jgi:dipeptidyl aminopeptidase/acylaminoacyl peptidase